jgi:hypothetical protein
MERYVGKHQKEPGHQTRDTASPVDNVRSPELHRPDTPRVARALALLIDEINHTPPAMPGDARPITYQLTASRPESNK